MQTHQFQRDWFTRTVTRIRTYRPEQPNSSSSR